MQFCNAPFGVVPVSQGSQWRGKKKVIEPFSQTVRVDFAALLHIRKGTGRKILCPLKLNIIRYKKMPRAIVSIIDCTGNALVTTCLPDRYCSK